MRMSLVCSVVLAVVTGVGVAPPQAPATKAPPAVSSVPIAPPAFDGNVANLEWGGRVESITGVRPNDGTMRNLISEVSNWIRTPDIPGRKDVVISLSPTASRLLARPVSIPLLFACAKAFMIPTQRPSRSTPPRAAASRPEESPVLLRRTRLR